MKSEIAKRISEKTPRYKKVYWRTKTSIIVFIKIKMPYYIQLLFLTPIWFFYRAEGRKSWKKFKSGLIKHKCEFDYSKPCYGENYPHYECKHLGCNIITHNRF